MLDVFKGTKNLGGKQVDLVIHDTSGDNDLGVNRSVVYNKANCFMICVSVNNRNSLNNVRKWRDEIR